MAAAEGGLRLYTLFDRETGLWLRELTDQNRGIGFRWSAHPFLPFTGTPNLAYDVQRDDGWAVLNIHGENNSYGFRTTEFDFDKKPGDVVVLAFGGSTTWGAIAETNATTWPGLLEQLLVARYPDRNLRVYNFGTSTATSVYSVVSLALIGVYLRPDLVIIYPGITDHEPMASKRYRPDHSHYYKDFDPELAWRGVRRSLPAWMLRSRVVTYISAGIDEALQVNSLQFYVAHPVDAETVNLADVTDRLTDNLATFNAIATGNGARTLFSTFQYYDPTGQPVNPALRRFYAEAGLTYVDQDALIPDLDRSINFDDCHFTRKGREMMAKNFFDYIVAHDLLGLEGADPVM
jgi:lysophospholipase L1-like esterase